MDSCFNKFFFFTTNVYANTFSINDIQISKPFENNFNKNEIIDEGFVEAFDQLILSIIQTKDQKKIKKTSLNIIKGMIETFSIKEERFIDEMYYLSLNVSFNKRMIFNLLESKNIFPSKPVKKDIFFIPIIIDENKSQIKMFSESYLFKNWNVNKKDYHILNYILPTEDLDDFNLIKSKSNNLENFNFQEIVNKYNLEDYIIMIIFKNNQEIRVLNKINFNGVKDLKNISFEDLNLNDENKIKKFIENIKTVYENYWKSKNEINTSLKLSLVISIENSDNLKISQFEKFLSNIDLIYDYYIFKFDNKKNIYKIIFNGLPDNFLKIMKKNNYKIDTQNQTWIIK